MALTWNETRSDTALVFPGRSWALSFLGAWPRQRGSDHVQHVNLAIARWSGPGSRAAGLAWEV